MKLSRRSRFQWGSVVVLLVFAMGLSSLTMALKFWNDLQQEYATTKNFTEGYRAYLLAVSGLQAGLSALQTVPEEFLFQTGLALNPPNIEVEDCKPKCFVRYSIQPEDGKINLNFLVRKVDDLPNDTYRNILIRLFTSFRIPIDTIDAIIDWIDQNEITEGKGAERSYYELLKPPKEIKNDFLYTLPEVLLVKDFLPEYLFTSRAPEGWEEEQKELAFLTEDEKTLLTIDDWILENNITAYVYSDSDTGKININAARYHVLMSLSDSMTRQAVLEIFKLRNQEGGYIKDLKKLQNLPSLQVKTTLGVTLYEELVGKGGQYTGLLKTEGEIYRITGIGTILPKSLDPNHATIRKVWILFDKKQKKIIYYQED
ncbi:MAG: type II secretion system protein GspK [Leptospiraceae bacterium]|nr:type II secretion system protein GspK [Leptospiraceae bacterium]MDW7976944.1 type II secretion system protein GspK [Leptospiraceae bacterium]